MKKLVFLILLPIFVLQNCSHLDIKKSAPSCIKSKIRDFEKTACDSGASVKEYSFQNETVFVFDPGTCGADMTSEVMDSDCNSLGFLGGISGNTKINGEEFSNAVFQSIIWENK